MSFAARLQIGVSQADYTIVNAANGGATLIGYSKGSYGTAQTLMNWSGAGASIVLEVVGLESADPGIGAGSLTISFSRLDGSLPTSGEVSFANLIVGSGGAPWAGTYAKAAFSESVNGSRRAYTLTLASPPFGFMGNGSTVNFSLRNF